MAKKNNAVKTWSTPVSVEKTTVVPCALCGSAQFTKALTCDGFGYVRCIRCGLVQMNPQPEISAVIARYSETHGADYCAYERCNEENFLRLQMLALNDAGFFSLEQRLFRLPKEAPSALDIGCATGSLLCELKKRGWRVCGVEISPAAGYARSERSLDVCGLPLEQNNFPGESFDVILASHVIEHLNDPDSFVREIYRLLKDGGSVFITPPNIGGFQARLFRGSWRSAIFDHLYLFSPETLKAMLIRAGFKIECISTWGGLAAGTAPPRLKKIADRLAKILALGDVMIVRAGKKAGNAN
jgi:2-polyprenyl-3-methyl-5-hydroxy-6-metoxy-1,4-benzoquinol methylase